MNNMNSINDKYGFTLYVLRKLVPGYDFNSVYGDFEELYESRLNNDGSFRAKIWLWRQILKSLPVFIKKNLYWSAIMFRNYLKIAFRNLKKHKGFSLINVSGLAMGMVCSILIFMYVIDELSFDKYHTEADNIYRIISPRYSVMQGPVGPLLKEKIPEIVDYTRFYAGKIWGHSILIGYQEKNFFIRDFYMADPSVFTVFDFPLIRGNPETVFSDPMSAVMTEETAERFFGDEDPIGKIVTYNGDFNFTVTGIMKNIPDNSHFDIEMLVPLESYMTVRSQRKRIEENWNNSAYFTYLLTTDNIDEKELQDKIAYVLENETSLEFSLNFILHPLTRIHLYSQNADEMGENGDIRFIYIFSTIAWLILFIACLNYMNLSTARSLGRAKEVGMRKVAGAVRSQLIRQFLGESILLNFFALLAAVGLILLILPSFNALSGKELSFSDFLSVTNIAVFLALSLFTGLLAGSLPAFFLSAFKPIKVITGKLSSNRNIVSLRSALVITQFTISICLIAGTLLISGQMKYIQNKKLGFEKEQIIVVPTMRIEHAIQKTDIIKNEFMNLPGIENVTLSSQTPGVKPFYRGIIREDDPQREWRSTLTLWTDPDFIKTYGMEIIAGRDFSNEISTDKSESFILNESAVFSVNYTSPQDALGKRISFDGKTGEIVGVVKDFHFMSLLEQIEPIVLHYNKSRFYSVSVRINTDNITSTINSLRDKWKEILPNVPFDYFFLDDDYARQYNAVQRSNTFLEYFTFLAIFISCLGLFGLAAYMTEQRTKEIGIRKALGASLSHIFGLLSKELIFLVTAANLVAWPLAYYFMTNWMQQFEYRMDIGLTTFVIAGLFAVVIAVVTISFQVLKASGTNPVDSLRYE
ncbi:MAG: FtsX-like permease family protein [bacterium]|nr:FtsX-like permease family protein [bacterium]